MEEEYIDKLKKAAKESSEKIAESTVFFGICSDNFVKDPVALIQLSLAILMDKPIFLVIQKGVKPSKNLIRILEGYEFYSAGDDKSFKQASEKLLRKVKSKIVDDPNPQEIPKNLK